MANKTPKDDAVTGGLEAMLMDLLEKSKESALGGNWVTRMAVKHAVMPALNKSPEAREAATDIIAGYILNLCHRAQAAGMDEQTIKHVVTNASRKALAVLHEEMEHPDMPQSVKSFAGSVVKHTTRRGR